MCDALCVICKKDRLQDRILTGETKMIKTPANQKKNDKWGICNQDFD